MFSIFICIAILASSAYGSISFVPKARTKEFKQAKRIKSILAYLDKGIIPTKTLNAFLRSNKKVKLFKNQKSSFVQLSKINKKQNDQFLKACSFTIDLKSDSKLNIHIKKKIKNYCHKKYFKMFTRKKGLAKKITLVQRDYFKSNIKSLLKRSNQWPLTKFLKKFPADSQIKKWLTTTIENAYILNIAKPTPRLLSELNITPRLTSHIQKKNVFDSKASKIFTREFRSIIKRGKRKIKSGNFDEGFKHVEESLSFYSQNKEFIKTKSAWLNLVSAGKMLMRRGEIQKANYIFKFTERLGNVDEKNDSIFYQLWPYLENEQYTKAIRVATEMKLFEKFDKLSSKLRFWLAYSSQMAGDKKIAKYFYEEQIKLSPISFYTILSLKFLNKLKNKNEVLDYNARIPAAISFEKKNISSRSSKLLTRIHIWSTLKSSKLVNIEVSDIMNNIEKGTFLRSESKDRSIGYSFLIKYLAKEKNFLSSFKIFYAGIQKSLFSPNLNTIKVLFPFQYVKSIKRNNPGIDPNLVLSLIRQESAFNPKASSSVGAKGLMQLMLPTARQFSKRVKRKHLLNPKTNLKIGMKFLKKLLVKQEGNLVFALSAYNAGEGNLKKWKRNIFKSENPLVNLESIPFRETRKYVKLIYRNLFFYRMLSQNKEFWESSLKDTFSVSLKH